MPRRFASALFIAIVLAACGDSANDGSTPFEPIQPAYSLQGGGSAWMQGTRGRINSSVHNSKFPGITAPTSVSEGATEPGGWDADDIRTTWIKNVG